MTARLVVALTLVGLGTLAGGPKSIQSDGTVRRDNLRKLLDRGDPAATRFSQVGPLFSAPLLLLDRGLGTDERCLVQYNLLLLAGGVAAFAVILPPTVRGRFAVLLVFGSMFPAYTLTYFGETFTALAVGVGLALVVVRRTAWGWVPVVLGVVNTPATAVGLLLAAGVYAWHERRWRPLIVVPMAAAGVLLENVIARGSPFATGYADDRGVPTVLPYSGRPGFSYPFLFGLLSILLSFGKGLVFFAPGLFLAPPKDDASDRLRLLLRVWVAFVVGLVLVYARWWAWYGGVCWGPRMLLFAALPAALVLARLSAQPADLGKNLLVLLALALSCWVGVSGFAFGQLEAEPEYHALIGDNYQTEFSLWYVPECSVLWLPFVIPVRVNAAQVLFLVLGGLACGYLCGPTLAVLARQLRGRLTRPANGAT